MNLKEKARQLPAVPGVYIMKDAYNQIIYVGKSKALKNRVSSYFINSKHHPPKVLKMVQNIRDFEYIITDTEFEAFILECNMISSIKPMYNRLMKSPEGYVYIRIDIMEKYPSILISSDNLQDNCLFFGPYSSHNTVRRAVEGIKEGYRILCNNNGTKKNTTRCLNYSLGLCMGMCQGDEVKEEYNEAVKSIIALLNGKNDTIIKTLEQNMLKSAEKLDFSDAAKFRDYMNAINHLINGQKIANYSKRNRNIVLAETLNDHEIKLFIIKRSKVLYKEKFNINEDMGAIKDCIKDRIFLNLKNKSNEDTKAIGKKEIDEAQIVYSYLRNRKNCEYIIIPEVWIVKDQEERLNEAVNKLLKRWTQHME